MASKRRLPSVATPPRWITNRSVLSDHLGTRGLSDEQVQEALGAAEELSALISPELTGLWGRPYRTDLPGQKTMEILMSLLPDSAFRASLEREPHAKVAPGPKRRGRPPGSGQV